MIDNWLEWERQWLAPWAAFSDNSAGRMHPEDECPVRTVYQRDRDRIIHSKAFRRLKHKAQVFIDPKDDHFRTRLTHTLEVSQIARTISRALRLNEDLTEAISLGHDLGHTPFGHAGERALDRLCGDFSHNRQSLRVVDVIEHDGQGLNLTAEVRDGILNHTGDNMPQTLEGQVVRICDRIAYLNHDIDDALRSGYLEYSQLPESTFRLLGERHSQRIDTVVHDIVAESSGQPLVRMSQPIAAAMDELRAFMFEHVYFHPRQLEEEVWLNRVVEALYNYFCRHMDEMPEEYRREPGWQAAADHIAGMTDNYALDLAARLFPELARERS